MKEKIYEKPTFAAQRPGQWHQQQFALRQPIKSAILRSWTQSKDRIYETKRIDQFGDTETTHPEQSYKPPPHAIGCITKSLIVKNIHPLDTSLSCAKGHDMKC